jgi:hypothetical protein
VEQFYQEHGFSQSDLANFSPLEQSLLDSIASDPKPESVAAAVRLYTNPPLGPRNKPFNQEAMKNAVRLSVKDAITRMIIKLGQSHPEKYGTQGGQHYDRHNLLGWFKHMDKKYSLQGDLTSLFMTVVAEKPEWFA